VRQLIEDLLLFVGREFALACEDEANIATSTELVLRLVQHYQVRMALKGFLIRGGITRGPICVTDEIVFGNALIESYLFECSLTNAPAISNRS
jgi:hypothetical protein